MTAEYEARYHAPPPSLLLPSASGLIVLTTRRQDDQTSAANRLIGEVAQSRRRPLLGPSPD